MIRRVKKNNRIMDNKGMTLIELLVGLFVFSIIAVSVLTVLVSSLGAYMRARDYAEVNTLMDNLAALVMDEVAGMTPNPPESISAPPDPIPGDVCTIFTTRYIVYSVHEANPPNDTRKILMWERELDDGFGTRERSPVLEANFYRTISLSDAELDVDEATGIVTLTLTVIPGSRGAAISRSYTARPVGLQSPPPPAPPP